HARHDEVDQHQIGLTLFGQHLHRVHTVRGVHGLIVLTSENRAHHLSNGGAVINDQNACAHESHDRRALRSSGIQILPVRGGGGKSPAPDPMQSKSLRLVPGKAMAPPRGFWSAFLRSELDLFADHFDVKIDELIVGYPSWSVAHQIDSLLGLRKGDHITQTVSPCQEHDKPVESQRDPTMRRRAKLQGLQQKAKLLVRLFFVNPQGPKHLLLHIGIMQTNGATADLKTIQNNVVAITKDLPRILVDQIKTFVVRSREGVVSRRPLLLVVVVLKERRVDDPKKIPMIAVPGLGNQAQLL